MFELKFPRVTEFFGESFSLADFQLINKLGKGTFGQVSLYRHNVSGKEYAIKRINFVKEGKKSINRE